MSKLQRTHFAFVHAHSRAHSALARVVPPSQGPWPGHEVSCFLRESPFALIHARSLRGRVHIFFLSVWNVHELICRIFGFALPSALDAQSAFVPRASSVFFLPSGSTLVTRLQCAHPFLLLFPIKHPQPAPLNLLNSLEYLRGRLRRLRLSFWKASGVYILADSFFFPVYPRTHKYSALWETRFFPPRVFRNGCKLNCPHAYFVFILSMRRVFFPHSSCVFCFCCCFVLSRSTPVNEWGDTQCLLSISPPGRYEALWTVIVLTFYHKLDLVQFATVN